MSPPPPWTQALYIRWRPELRYFESRFRILRELQDRGDLKAFRVRDEDLDARLFDNDHQLTVGQSGASLHLFRPDADVERAWMVMQHVVDVLRPTIASHVDVMFQHILGLSISRNEALSASRERLFTLPGVAPVEYDDWALLIDLRAPGFEMAQAEIGIIRADEAIVRLSRASGRMMSSGSVDPSHWEQVRFPDVGLFADSRWEGQLPEGGEQNLPTRLSAVKAVWGDARQHATRVVETVYTRVFAESGTKGGEAA